MITSDSSTMMAGPGRGAADRCRCRSTPDEDDASHFGGADAPGAPTARRSDGVVPTRTGVTPLPRPQRNFVDAPDGVRHFRPFTKNHRHLHPRPCVSAVPRLLHEDENWLVFDKPVGLPTIAELELPPSWTTSLMEEDHIFHRSSTTSTSSPGGPVDLLSPAPPSCWNSLLGFAQTLLRLRKLAGLVADEEKERRIGRGEERRGFQLPENVSKDAPLKVKRQAFRQARAARQRELGAKVTVLNRLDKDVSGIVVLAKGGGRAGVQRGGGGRRRGGEEDLIRSKRYVAVVLGRLAEPRKIETAGLKFDSRAGRAEVVGGELCADQVVTSGVEEETSDVSSSTPDGTTSSSIEQDHDEDNTSIKGASAAPSANKRRAVTHVQPLLYVPTADVTVVGVRLQTGQRHQIRCHLGFIGHPIVNDKVYLKNCPGSILSSPLLESPFPSPSELRACFGSAAFEIPAESGEVIPSAGFPSCQTCARLFWEGLASASASAMLGKESFSAGIWLRAMRYDVGEKSFRVSLPMIWTASLQRSVGQQEAARIVEVVEGFVNE